VYEELITGKEIEEVNYESLKDQWYSGLISHTDSLINLSEIEILEESWNNFINIMNEWLWEIDEKIPGQYGHIAKWLSQAEKWFKQVDLKWYQKPSGTEAMGFCITVNQSWRPSSAEPPYSPPSNELIDKLQNERLTNNLPSTLIDRLSSRLSKVTGYEPGYSAVLNAAKARRTFLDILYNVNRTETSTGVRIRSRRRESATGFEYRFCNWLDLVDGNIHTETREIVNGILTDYQVDSISLSNSSHVYNINCLYSVQYNYLHIIQVYFPKYNDFDLKLSVINNMIAIFASVKKGLLKSSQKCKMISTGFVFFCRTSNELTTVI
ncbi:unnamed protein product, partial [Schistosoma mattheei]